VILNNYTKQKFHLNKKLKLKMRNEVYSILFLYFFLNTYVFGNFFKRSSRLRKTSYYLSKKPKPVNYCPENEKQSLHESKKIHHKYKNHKDSNNEKFHDKIFRFEYEENYIPPSNRLLEEYKKNIIYPDEQFKNQGKNEKQEGKSLPIQLEEDSINPEKFIKAPGDIPVNLVGKNYVTLNSSGLKKLYDIITPQRWKKDHSKENNQCFGDLSFYNQGRCGSCFIFSAVSFFSISRCLATGHFISYSHQDMVSCSPPRGNQHNNCQGGLPKLVWEYMVNDGVLEQSCKCYQSFDGKIEKCNRNKCFYGGHPEITKPETKEVIHIRHIMAITYAIEYAGPLMAGISINTENIESLNDFNEGIQGRVKYDLKKLFGALLARNNQAHHAIVIVGYRIR